MARRLLGSVSRGAVGGGAAAWCGMGPGARHGPRGVFPPPVGNWGAESERGRGGRPQWPRAARG